MKGWKMLVLAVGIGAVNALVFRLFEDIVNHGTDLIWNDWFNSDVHRWVVIPLAIVLSIVFSVVLRLLKKPRWIVPHTSLELNLSTKPAVKLGDIGSILAVGATGLLAGASLGPEMPLTEISEGIGKWLASKLRVTTQQATVMIAASIGALMVAFLGSMIMIVLPFLLLVQQKVRMTFDVVVMVLLAGATSYGTLWLLNHTVAGYGTIPASSSAHAADYMAAAVVGLCISIAALALVRLIGWLAQYTKALSERTLWYIAAAVFGLVIGALYLLGGEPVQFSGSAGSSLLLHTQATYGTWAFLGMAIIKLVATAWSKTTGYRGGLYFPSIFTGVALGLWMGSLWSGFGGPGAMIGAIAAIFAALSIPDKIGMGRKEYGLAALVAFLFMAALLPFVLLPLALVAIIAAIIGNRLLVRLMPPPARSVN